MSIKDRLQQLLNQPAKLSETEREKFTEAFNVITEFIKEKEKEVLEMDRDSAYAELEAISKSIVNYKDPQTDYVKVNIDPEQKEVIDTGPLSGINKPYQNIRSRDSRGRTPVDLSGPRPGVPTGPAKKVTKPTTKEFAGWLSSLTDRAKSIAGTLDCVKGFLDEEVGIDVVCPECSKQALTRCIMDADPTIDDPITLFIRGNLE